VSPILISRHGVRIHTPDRLETSKRVTKASSSILKRDKVTPLEPINCRRAGVHTNHDNFLVNDLKTEEGDRWSPALSDRTNRSVKRVGFCDNDVVATGTGSRPVSSLHDVPTSQVDRKRAKRRRERDLRKRLLSTMGEAEVRTLTFFAWTTRRQVRAGPAILLVISY